MPDGRMAAGLQLGAGKGLEFNVGAEAARATARAPEPRESWLGRRVPRAGDLLPWGQRGPRRGPRSIIHSVLQVPGLELAARMGRAAAPWAVTFSFFSLPFLWQP